MATLTRTRPAFLTGVLVLCMALAGCETVNDVTIDSISRADRSLGTSYRLIVHDPSGGVDKELQNAAVAHIRKALGARGLYEAPPGVQPDMEIFFEYGVGPGHIKFVYNSTPQFQIDPAYVRQPGAKSFVVFEKFFKLSAREPAPVPGSGQVRIGEELWSVHTSVEDTKKEMEPYLAVLASACIDYIGQNTGEETHLTVKSREAQALLGQVDTP